MTRIVKEYTVRRNEILDVALNKIQTKGYEQMTTQEIVDELQIAKGTFFYYFGSKQALLEALVERILDEKEEIISPIVQDPHLSAPEKLQRFFTAIAQWKTTQKTFLFPMLRVWYTDDNAIVRLKVHDAVVKRDKPELAEIIRQGIREGVFTTSYPEQVAGVVLSLVIDLTDTLARLLLSYEQNVDIMPDVESTIAAYTGALERILDVPTASLHIVDEEFLKEWVEHLERQNA